MSKKPEGVTQEAWDAVSAMWQRGRGIDDIARAIMAATAAERERCSNAAYLPLQPYVDDLARGGHPEEVTFRIIKEIERRIRTPS